MARRARKSPIVPLLCTAMTRDADHYAYCGKPSIAMTPCEWLKRHPGFPRCADHLTDDRRAQLLLW